MKHGETEIHLIVMTCHIYGHDVTTAEYKYKSLVSFKGVLAYRIRDATREAFVGDYYDEVILLYGRYRDGLRDTLRYLLLVKSYLQYFIII